MGGPQTPTDRLATTIRQLRRDRQWSAQTLADQCAALGAQSLSRSTIAKIEAGVRRVVTVDELAALAEAFGLLPEELICRADKRPRPVKVFRAPPRNPGFMGRASLLFSVRAGLESAGSYALVAPTGYGKSALATEFTYRYMHKYDIVWWVHGGSEDAVKDQVASLAVAAEWVDRGADDTDKLRGVQTALEDRGRWLLVFDGARGPSRVVRLFSQLDGHVLVTTRDRAWDDVLDTTEIPPFARHESTALLRTRLAINDQDAEAIARAAADVPGRLWSVAREHGFGNGGLAPSGTDTPEAVVARPAEQADPQPPDAPAEPAGAGVALDEEANWQAIRDSDDYRDFELHRQQWPGGRYTMECQAAIDRLAMAD